MKDEEMAEEYASARRRNLHLSQRDTNLIHLAYLHGLKAGRPQWHKLTENPNDLPKLDKTDMSDYVITDKGVAYYNGRVKSWYIQNEYILSDDVIAWCELPTFDKE